MNILYYIPYLKKEYGGVYQYALALLKILAKDRSNNYFILNVDNNEDVAQIIRDKPNFRVVDSRDYLWLDKRDLYKRLRLSLSYRSVARRRFIASDGNFFVMLYKYKIDIIHSPSQTLPQSNIPRICTMHDVQELHFPAFFDSAERARRAVNYKYIIDNADKVVVSYKHIKGDIERFFSKRAEDVETILLDMENLWLDKFLLNGAPNGELRSPTKFLLYPAATWEHKNHLNLIKAVHILKKEENLSIKVICTGNKTENYSVIESSMRDLGVEECFEFLGIVDDATLFALYQSCYGVVVPTLYEAGSFPLMESILLGKPVICSNVTSLPETIGDVQFTFDPQNVREIAKILFRFWQDQTFYDLNLSKIGQRAESLRFNDALSKFLCLYSSIEKKSSLKLDVVNNNHN